MRHQGALIVTRDTSAVTISPGKGSGDPTNASGSGNGRLTAKWRTKSCISFHVTHFLFLSQLISLILKVAAMYDSGFGKLEEDL